MRTSPSQFQILVDFMERHGDLSKISDGAHGKITNIQNWMRLTKILNSDASGQAKSAAKWKKVWSDFKNNTKRKAARLAEAESNLNVTSGRITQLSDIELRVINMIGQSLSAEVVELPEVDFEQEQGEFHRESSAANNQSSDSRSGSDDSKCNPADWDQPGPSERKKSKSSTGRHWRLSHPSRRKVKTETPKSDENMKNENKWLSFQKEVEKERIRIRKRELQHQGRWLDLFEQFLDLGNRVVDVVEKK